MGRIRAGHKPIVGRIHAPARLDESPLVFSFRFLDCTNPKFKVDGTDDRYIHALLARLRDLGSWTFARLRAQGAKALRFHPINWDHTTEPQGFPHIPQDLQDTTAWQFQISANEHGRIHGVVVDDVFHIVWLDPHHHLYGR